MKFAEEFNQIKIGLEILMDYMAEITGISKKEMFDRLRKRKKKNLPKFKKVGT